MTKIEWTKKTWNPVIGCKKISKGCQNCYAEKMSIRINNMLANNHTEKSMDTWAAYSSILKFNYNNPKYPDGNAIRFNGKVSLMYNRLDEPLHWKKSCEIFVNSMSDLFHEDVSFRFIDNIWETMLATPQHTYQILTKRPERMLKYFNETGEINIKPLPNVHIGVSVEDQQTGYERIPLLIETPAAIRFVSLEPLLEPINLPYYYKRTRNMLDWIIIGCESGGKRRECKTRWIEYIAKQCRIARMPLFIKQISINGKVEKDINKFPKELQIREYPK